MSESVTLPQTTPIEAAIGTAPALTQSSASIGGTAEPAPPQTTAPVDGPPEQSIAHALALPSALPPEMHAMLELIGRGLVPEADDATRNAARELWTRLAQTLATTVSAMPAAPVTPAPVTPAPVMPAPSQPAPVIPAMPVMPTVPLPTSPIAMAARTLRQLSPDQLLDLALQRLRAVLPAGSTVPTPKGIQFQLVPVTQPDSQAR